MIKKTKLVHESLENRQLLAVGCNEIHRGQVSIDISGVDCTFDTPVNLLLTSTDKLQLKVDSATVSLVAKPLATPTLSKTLCESADAKGYTLPGCLEDTKAVFTAVLNISGNTDAAPTVKSKCTATISKEITLPKSTLINRTAVTATAANLQFGNIVTKLSEAENAAAVFATTESSEVAVADLAVTKVTTGGALNLVFDVCSDSTGLSFIEATSKAAVGPYASLLIENAGVPIPFTITGTGTGTIATQPTVTINAVGFDKSAGVAAGDDPTIGNAIANYNNVNLEMLNAAQKEAILNQFSNWKYGNTTNVAPMFG